ncbi:copper resistance protein B [Vitreimonas sp.]|uniref:copper resistance protein B n=1 Tax=Vitreimonas sp. TaxID=3069702 RepID=UPI002ED8960A
MRMIAALFAPLVLAAAMPAAAQDHTHYETEAPAPDPHAEHGTTAAPQPAPASIGDTQANAADLYFDPEVMARARQQLLHENGGMRTHAILLEQLEVGFDDDEETYAWHAQGWYGGDIHRFWWKTEGEGAFDDELEHAELQLLYSRAVTPYFDLQGGLRQSTRDGEEWTDLVLGLQGLAPYWFEVGVAAFISTDGDVTARAEAEYDLRLTQRLILQPSAELELAAQDIPTLDIAAGFTEAEIGVRLRYEITRRFAPYVGVTWASAIGETRDLRDAGGAETESTRAVLGLRTWF